MANGNKDAYIAALEQKLAEISGIELDQIRKNQVKMFHFIVNFVF